MGLKCQIGRLQHNDWEAYVLCVTILLLLVFKISDSYLLFSPHPSLCLVTTILKCNYITIPINDGIVCN